MISQAGERAALDFHGGNSEYVESNHPVPIDLCLGDRHGSTLGPHCFYPVLVLHVALRDFIW